MKKSAALLLLGLTAVCAVATGCGGGGLSQADADRCNQALADLRSVLTFTPRSITAAIPSPEKVALAARQQHLSALAAQASASDVRSVFYRLAGDVEQIPIAYDTSPSARARVVQKLATDSGTLDKVCNVKSPSGSS